MLMLYDLDRSPQRHRLAAIKSLPSPGGRGARPRTGFGSGWRLGEEEGVAVGVADHAGFGEAGRLVETVDEAG
jgi:hypothetical protein